MTDPKTSLTRRLAVCSWSLRPEDPHDLIAKLESTGIRRVQLALDPLRAAPEVWGDAAGLFQESGIAIVSGMFGCVGEDYSTLESIRLTGGIAPDETWDQNLANIHVAAGLAKQLELGLVTFHAGFLPHEPSSPDFAKMLQRLGEVAEVFSAEGIAVGLETGQETAASLAVLLEQLNRSDVGVNFDPANMILYGKGDPIQALRVLGSWIRQVHLKDATRTHQPGAWGSEVPVGEGDVDWSAFFGTLKELKYAGDFAIEREAGIHCVSDICAARTVFLNSAD